MCAMPGDRQNKDTTEHSPYMYVHVCIQHKGLGRRVHTCRVSMHDI